MATDLDPAAKALFLCGWSFFANIYFKVEMHLRVIQNWIKISDSVDLNPILAMSTDCTSDLHE